MDQQAAQHVLLERIVSVLELRHLSHALVLHIILIPEALLYLLALHVQLAPSRLLALHRYLNVFHAVLVLSAPVVHANSVLLIPFQPYLAPHPAQLAQLEPCPSSTRHLALH